MNEGGAEVDLTSAHGSTRAASDECVVYAKPLGRGNFHWGWHSPDGKRRSRAAFTYFYDCVLDARRHGYEVDPARVAAQLSAAKLTVRVVPTLHERVLEGETHT